MQSFFDKSFESIPWLFETSKKQLKIPLQLFVIDLLEILLLGLTLYSVLHPATIHIDFFNYKFFAILSYFFLLAHLREIYLQIILFLRKSLIKILLRGLSGSCGVFWWRNFLIVIVVDSNETCYLIISFCHRW